MSKQVAKTWLLDGPMPIPGLVNIVAGYAHEFESILKSSISATATKAIVAFGESHIAAGQGADIHIYDIAADPPELFQILFGHTGKIRALSEYAGEAPTVLLASGSADCTARVWDAAGACVFGPHVHPGEVYSVAFVDIEDCMMLATGCYDCKVRIWNGDGLVKVVPCSSPIISLTNVAGNLVAGMWDSWRLIGGLRDDIFNGGAYNVADLNGRIVVSNHRRLSIWNGSTCICSLDQAYYIESIAVMSDGSLLSASGGLLYKWNYDVFSRNEKSQNDVFRSEKSQTDRLSERVIASRPDTILALKALPNCLLASCESRFIRIWR